MRSDGQDPGGIAGRSTTPPGAGDPAGALGPVEVGERTPSIDVLRGFALLGILVMNINAFALPVAAYANPFVAGGSEGADLWAWIASHLLFEFKMVTIFSMLFGAGLVLMTERATARGGEVKGIYLRRNLWLLLIGALHGYLLWFGDILFHYALSGLILCFFRTQPARRLLWIAAVLILINVPLFMGFGSMALEQKRSAEKAEAELAAGRKLEDLPEEERDALEQWREMRPEMAPTPEDLRTEIDTYRGGYWGILADRAPKTFMMQTVYFLLFGLWRTTGAMLLGMALMKLGVFSARLPARFYTLCMLIGYGAGLPLVWIGARGLIAHRFDLEYAVGGVGAFNYFGSLGVAMAHVGVVMRVCQSGALAWLRRRLAAVGRMALTNYLLHSVICTTLFYGYGFSLFASLSRARLQGVVAALAILQLVASPLWLRRFRFGPAEWVWRSLTYGKRQPWRAARPAMRLTVLVILAAIAGTSGCARGPNPSEVLARLADEYWQGTLAANPLLATGLGDRRYDHLLSDISPAGREKEWARLTDLAARAKGIRAEDLSSADRLTHAILLTQIENDLAAFECRLEEWVVDPGGGAIGGPQSAFLDIESYQPVRTPEEGRAMAQRWRAMGPYLEAHMGNLRRGLGGGKVAVHESVLKVIDQLRNLLRRPDRDWPLLRPLAVERPGWSEAERAELRDSLTAAVREVVRPAFKAYHQFLRQEILPRSRPQERPGLVALPDGLACYSNLIRVHTSFVLPPDDVHGVGLAEIERINREMEALGRKVLKVRTRREVLRRLRSSPQLHFKSRDEVEDKARAALTGAVAALSEWFGRLPKAGCEVVRMEPHEESYSTIAYYRQPAADGSRPGRYYINTSAPATRPRYEAEALAYHESIPGHHLQIAIAQELEGLPEFRKHLGSNAFVEGWALYAERLADEMKLYSSDLDRIGKLSYDAWRACRLVVDTGLHAKGWSRERAIDFMLENSALARNNIVNEVDRYINNPGQALGYKIGQIEILRLREEARRRLGKRFDIRAFHDVVLGNGALPLDPLRGLVGEYIDRTLQSRPAQKKRSQRAAAASVSAVTGTP